MQKQRSHAVMVLAQNIQTEGGVQKQQSHDVMVLAQNIEFDALDILIIRRRVTGMLTQGLTPMATALCIAVGRVRYGM